MNLSVQLHALAALLAGKKTIAIALDAGWAPGSASTLWSREKSLVYARNRTLFIKSEASRCIH
jgi:hypothetical protein